MSEESPHPGIARSAVATNEAQSVQPSSSGDPFFNEVAILDEEIKELRRRLAQKLDLQNAQLKRCLSVSMCRKLDVNWRWTPHLTIR